MIEMGVLVEESFDTGGVEREFPVSIGRLLPAPFVEAAVEKDFLSRRLDEVHRPGDLAHTTKEGYFHADLSFTTDLPASGEARPKGSPSG